MDMPNGPQRSLQQLAQADRQRHDLFIGLVAPLGSSNKEVRESLEEKLATYAYSTKRAHLAGLLDDLDFGSPLPGRGSPDYHEKRMDAGDRLRKEAGDHSALAALAIAYVAGLRQERRTKAIEEGARVDPSPVAYIFDSLKHPRESQLLRNVYGAAYWQISIVEDDDERIKNLARVLGESEGSFDSAPTGRAQILIDRDEADVEAKHGQNVRDVFAQSDFYLAVSRGKPWMDGLDRFLKGAFDSPFLSPSADEEAMRIASAASLRSAAIGRQVGAAIVPPSGSPILMGTNEVPRPGGGQFREGDVPDFRDFQSGADPNPAYTESVIRELFNRLAKAGFFTPDRNAAGGVAILREAKTPGEDGKSLLDGTRAKSLIEFTRCLHAEQAAIVEAARTGTAIQDARLYTTTFPCHECTKFIVGAGISEVQYVEPYPKSLAGDMYGDLIDARPPLDRTSSTSNKIPFKAFLGFGPSRYDEVFTAGKRRSGSKINRHVPAIAIPVGNSWSELAVVEQEDSVVMAVAASADLLANVQSQESSENDKPGQSASERDGAAS